MCQKSAIKSLRRSRKRSSSKGFSITEVVLASALLIISIVPILKALTTAQFNSVVIEHKTRSLTLAQAKFDEIRAQSIYNYENSFAANNTSVDQSYLCNVADTAISDTLREITVSVGYDINADNVLEPNEVGITLATHLAKRW